ncbi:MAG: glycosyltransferase family 4 protein [Deltaproteobacteria bacterium]|nr:glycosyltransferase family 4 protein [Deltaproteobacteria bacterium]
MRIAQVAPLYESVPPKLYGGSERVVSYLTEELVKQGHEVTLFASGDSNTRANLQAVTTNALRLKGSCRDPLAHHVLLLEKVFQEAAEYDIVHFHIDYLHFPLSRLLKIPHVTTMHGRLDLADLEPVFMEFSDMPVVSISNSQRGPLPMANWQGTVYNGVPEDLYSFHPERGNYLAFIGRFSPEKRVDRAIEIARRADMEIRIAAKIDQTDKSYFKERIKPLLNHPLVTFVGEIGEREKDDFLGNAAALLFPIDWPEPFGLVMIEAMACGTPVIAYRHGAVPEVLRDGITGFIVDNLEDAVTAVHRVPMLNRSRCRQVFEERFSAEKMADGYLAVYRKIININQMPHLAA